MNAGIRASAVRNKTKFWVAGRCTPKIPVEKLIELAREIANVAIMSPSQTGFPRKASIAVAADRAD
jgi:hypothetical protein